ncbi:hypothetical protein [Cupriavidus sp. USMAA2-4]|uniref:hypothetical protein n=1 Tax=Cupriavidus sp. USMAA2-4 TaxID=876364 RepID=UPI0018DE7FD7|nr:hypothetical protein [Cupriavidus sp. USMAA2-4]
MPEPRTMVQLAEVAGESQRGRITDGSDDMGKRKDKEIAGLAAAALFIGVPIYVVSKVNETVGWIAPLCAIAAVVALVLAQRASRRKARLEYLRVKYQDEVVVQRIVGGQIWQTQSAEQLIDSIGRPLSIDQKLLKTKTREVWKYNHRGANRYGLRVTVEDGYVTGWDQKT